jgi:type IV pilus assembly protein PilC
VPKYFYTARTQTGEAKSGVMEAKDKHELAQTLRQEGSLLISATAEDEEIKKKKKLEISLPFFGRVSLKEKMFFTRNLRVMISSGLPLPRSLKILAGQTKNQKLSRAIADVDEQVTKGQSFSEALSRHGDIFSELFRNMIKVGEEAGTLEDVLRVLTEQMERENEMRSKILSALIYPAVIILAMSGIGIAMLILVVPKLAVTFKELNIELPPTTKFVIFLGTFLAARWYLAILIVIAFVVLMRMALRTKIGKNLIDAVTLRIPIISPIIKKSNSASTTRTLSSLIIAGVPIVRSLEIISRSLGNVYFRNAIAEAAEKVRKGGKLFEALKPYQHLYPLLVIQMIEIGEETGETSTILTKLADFYEEEVANTTKNLSAIVEPVLMLLIGGAVGFFAIAMIQPMYSMLQAIQ